MGTHKDCKIGYGEVSPFNLKAVYRCAWELSWSTGQTHSMGCHKLKDGRTYCEVIKGVAPKTAQPDNYPHRVEKAVRTVAYLREFSEAHTDFWMAELDSAVSPERKGELINRLVGAKTAKTVNSVMARLEDITKACSWGRVRRDFQTRQECLDRQATRKYINLAKIKDYGRDAFERLAGIKDSAAKLNGADKEAIDEIIAYGARVLYENVKYAYVETLPWYEWFCEDELIASIVSGESGSILLGAMQLEKPQREPFPFGFNLHQCLGRAEGDIPKLEKILRPGRASEAGFLGPNESLLRVMFEDWETLNQFGITHLEIAVLLEDLFGRRSNCDYHHIKVGNEKYEVTTMCTMGSQHCPICHFNGRPPWHGGSCDYTFKKTSTGEMMVIGELLYHLIRRHKFFEGKGTSYGLDPERFITFFGMDKGHRRAKIWDETTNKWVPVEQCHDRRK